jgi:hypothetical protein
MPPPTADRDLTLPTDELPHEPERIALRSSLPSMPKPPAFDPLPGFPSYDTEIELPRNSFADVAPKVEPKKLPEPPKVEAPKNRIAEPVVAAKPAEPENIDIAYFPTRAMLPELAALTLISAGWIMGVMPLLPAWWQSWEVYAAVPGAYGSFVLVQWLFRVIGGGYRLTKKQLFRVHAGPLANPEPLDLATIAHVKADASILEMCLAVGRIRITFERDVHPEVVLGPVGWPRRRAMRIEEAAELAREGSVVGSRMAA